MKFSTKKLDELCHLLTAEMALGETLRIFREQSPSLRIFNIYLSKFTKGRVATVPNYELEVFKPLENQEPAEFFNFLLYETIVIGLSRLFRKAYIQ